MRKLVLILGLIGVSAGNSICDNAQQILEKHAPLKGLPYKIVSTRMFKNLCEIVIDIKNELIPLYTNGLVLISGEAWVNKKPVTQEFLQKLRKRIFKKQLEKLDSYTVAVYNSKGEKLFYFVADPECPYSNWVKEKVKKLADEENATIKLVLLPLPIHKGSALKVESFVCGNKSFEDYLSGNYGNFTCPKGKRYVQTIFRNLPFLRATPTFVIPKKDNLEVIVGTNLKRLKRELENWK